MADHPLRRTPAHRSLPALSRRAVLVGMASVGLAACLPPRGTGGGGAAFFGIPDPRRVDGLPDGLFTLGVSSGDPTPDGFVLWTRLAPDPLAGGGMPDIDVPVRWQVALDPSFAQVVADGEVSTSSSVGHSIHIDVTRLAPDQVYHYRFTTGGQVSPVGRTRTAPPAGAPVDHLRLAVASCQSYTNGYYGAWGAVVADQPDLVVFLGDYIYEGGPGSGVRRHNSAEIKTLVDYRNRYALYKSDPLLQAAHATAPWVVTWDDHEVENDYAGLIPQDRADDPIFAARRADAYQAYWEHQPLRNDVSAPGSSLYRSLQWGSLLDLLVLDGRQYRSDHPCGGASIGVDCADRTDADRTMLGAAQRAWLQSQLASVQGQWTVLANQTVMTPMPIGTAFNFDQWDGYPAERSQVLGWLAQVANPVVLTGDIHCAGLGLLRDEAAGSPTVGTEIIATSISSRSDTLPAEVLNSAIGGLPQFGYFEARYRGYSRCDVTPDGWDIDYVTVDALTPTPGPARVDSSWRLADGARGAVVR